MPFTEHFQDFNSRLEDNHAKLLEPSSTFIPKGTTYMLALRSI